MSKTIIGGRVVDAPQSSAALPSVSRKAADLLRRMVARGGGAGFSGAGNTSQGRALSGLLRSLKAKGLAVDSSPGYWQPTELGRRYAQERPG